MAYSNNTLKKYIAKMNERISYYASQDVYKIALCISNGNEKIGRVMNVSLPPIITCANCKECKSICYDIKANMLYDNVVDARARNLVILRKNRELFFQTIDQKMSRRRKNKYFRWHVAGDIIDMDYLERMIENARRHPDFTIWTYTKNYDVVNKWIAIHGKDAMPKNFTIMFSEWRGLPMDNAHNMPEFRVVFKDDAIKPDPKKVFYCPGNCDVCKENHRGCIAGETTYCYEH